MDDPSDRVVDPLGRRVGLVTTLVADDPHASSEKTGDEDVG